MSVIGSLVCDACGKTEPVKLPRFLPFGWHAQVTRERNQRVFHFCPCVPESHITVTIMSLTFEEAQK